MYSRLLVYALYDEGLPGAKNLGFDFFKVCLHSPNYSVRVAKSKHIKTLKNAFLLLLDFKVYDKSSSKLDRTEDQNHVNN